MSDFILHTERDRNDTPVSNIFLDEYMPQANGEYVKVYLFLLRAQKSGSQSLSIPAIADRFDHTEKDVYRALAYWEKMQLLRLEHDSRNVLTGICLLEPVSRQKTAPVPERAAAAPEVPPKTSYSADQLAHFQEQNDIRQLLFVSEQYLGKTLSPSEISSILYFYDGLHFSADLIEYLIEYCVTKNHRSMRYIESVAIAWHKEGYTTAAQVKKESSLYGKNYFAVLKAFGIKGRSPVESEVQWINKWLQEYSFSPELIMEACGRTMAAIHQPSFEYADSILKKWHDAKVHTMEDVTALDAKHSTAKRTRKPAADSAAASKGSAAPNRFHNFEQRDYDFAELEKQLINH